MEHSMGIFGTGILFFVVFAFTENPENVFTLLNPMMGNISNNAQVKVMSRSKER